MSIDVMTKPILASLYHRLSRMLVLGCCWALSLAAAAQDGVGKLEMLSSPAPANSSLSRIVSDEAGNVYLSWVSQQEGMATLSYARLIDTGWTSAETISRGSDWFINWADFPALSVNNGNMVAHWLRKSDEGNYDYDIEASFYDAKRRSWSEAGTIHKDGVSAEHGFVSMTPMGAGHTLITWLDGRETAGQDPLGAMTLRAGIFDTSGSTITEWELDHRVCDCCQTSSAMTREGPIVVYRDRSQDEIRDTYVTRYSDGTWSEPKAVYNDNWQIAGCPVNGPSVAAQDEQVAVSWFTAKDDTPKVQLAVSTDSGESFSLPISVATPNTNGRVGTVILESGRIAVSWLDTTKQQAQLMLSLFSPEGRPLETTKVAATSASRRSGFPIIEAIGESVYLSWTDISEVPRVRIARVDYME